MKVGYLILLILSLFIFSKEQKTKSECHASHLSCTFKCGLLNKKDDYIRHHICIIECENIYQKCLKFAKK
jgi:hypothetical protein